MIVKHLSDTDIQNYALQDSECTAAIVTHIEQCAYCQQKAKQYKMLFEKINTQEPSMFEFDVAKLVLPQLKQTPKFSLSISVIYLLVFIGMVAFGIIFYQFSTSITNILSGTAASVIVTACLITTIVMLLQYIDLFKNYQKKMDLLDSY
ncbi:hypothetical protein GCM10027049_18980 [Mucilaginibacter puniceus]